MTDRKKCCPICGFPFLCRCGEEVMCLAPNCEWRVQAKRKDDFSLPTAHKLRALNE